MTRLSEAQWVFLWILWMKKPYIVGYADRPYGGRERDGVAYPVDVRTLDCLVRYGMIFRLKEGYHRYELTEEGLKRIEKRMKKK